MFQMDVLGKQWKIKEIGGYDAPFNAQRYYGMCVFFEKTIYLNKDLSTEQKMSTLAHELSHAVLYETQVESIPDADEARFSEENLCTFMGLYGALITYKCELYKRHLDNVVGKVTKEKAVSECELMR